MPAGPTFPAFIKIEHSPNPSAKATLLAEVLSTTKSAEQMFRESFNEIGSIIGNTFTQIKGKSAGLDLGVSGLKQNAADANYAAERLKLMAAAAQSAADKVRGMGAAYGDVSEATVKYAQALSAQAAEAARAKTAADAQVNTYQRLQAEVDQLISKNQQLAQSYRDTFAEQARSTNFAHGFQQSLNETYGIGQTSKSASDSAKVFMEAERYAQNLELVRRAIDPTRVAQQELDVELGRADLAFARGEISAQEYGVAVNRAATNFENMVNGAKRGTEANHLMVNSQRAARVASIQFGQQMQDVVIQTQMGTKAITIFTQQVPQMAFALSGLEGNANKTLSKLGAFGSFMAGPWGAAIFAATAILGPFIADLFMVGDESEKATKKTYDFSQGIDVLRLTAVNAAEAMKQLADATKGAIKEQGTFIASNLATADQAVSALEARLAQNKATLKKLQDDADANILNPFYQPDLTRIKSYKDTIAADETALASARMAQTNAEVADSQMRVTDAVDASAAAMNRYNEALGQLNAQYARSKDDPIGTTSDGSFISRKDYEAKLQVLKKSLKDAQDAAKPSTGQYGREIDLEQAKSIAAGAGFRVTSDRRTIAEQQWLYDNKRTAENPVAKPDANAPHVRGNALDIAFGPGVTEASLKKAYQDQGVRLTKILKETGHFHIEWSTSGADKASREAQELARFGQEAADRIARIGERWNEQPRMVDAIKDSTRQLDKIMKDLETRKPAGWQSMVEAAKKAQEAAANFIDNDITKWTEESNQQWEIQKLMLAGYDDEAAKVAEIARRTKTQGELTAEQTQRIREQVQLEQDRGRAMQKAQEIQNAYLDASRSIRGELEAIFSGDGSLANFGKIFQRLNSKILVEKLFGDMFRDLDKWVMKNTGLDDATQKLTDNTNTLGNSLLHLEGVVDSVSAGLSGGASSGAAIAKAVGAGSGLTSIASVVSAAAAKVAANDEIVVNGRKPTSGTPTVNDLTPMDFFKQSGDQMAKSMTKALDAAFDVQFFGKFAGALGGAFAGLGATGGSPLGAGLGLLASIPALGGQDGIFGKMLGGATGATQLGLLSQSLGIGGSTAGAQIGGALGSLIPGGSLIGSVLGLAIGGKKMSIGKMLGGLAGSAIGAGAGGALGSMVGLGSLGGPVGAVIGLVLGGLLGGLFGSKPKGSGTISNSGYSGSANRDNITENLTSLGGGVNSAIDKIASALGVKAGSYALSVGMYKDWYQVSNIANDPLIGKAEYNQKSSNEAYDGKDAQAALVAAIKVAIQQGAFKAIGATANRILSNGSSDIDQALQDTKDFMDVFKTLKQYTDPVGAALDELDSKFTHLKDIFIQNGATAEEYAQLEKLYGIERAKAIESNNNQIIGSLKNLVEQMTQGDMGLSLKDRLGNAMGDYSSLESRVKAGDVTAYDAYAKSAQTVLDLNRQINGSQDGYWSTFDQIKGVASGAIDAQTSLTSASANRDSPFSPSAVNDNASVVGAIDAQTAALAARLDGIYGLMASNGGNGYNLRFDNQFSVNF